jgi:hypothetical protein
MRLAGFPSPLRFAVLAAVLCAAALAGCGGGGDSTGAAEAPGGTGATQSGEPAGATSQACGPNGLKATGIDCDEAKSIAADWHAAPGCAVVAGGSHGTCKIQGYLCIAATVGRGTAVSCALPDRDAFFFDPR